MYREQIKVLNCTIWDGGATMVKVFSVSCFTPKYFKELRGPFSDIQLLACDSVREENIKEYFENGANAVAFDASVFRKDLIGSKNFSVIKKYTKFPCATSKGAIARLFKFQKELTLFSSKEIKKAGRKIAQPLMPLSLKLTFLLN